jgi:hypothetical protein
MKNLKRAQSKLLKSGYLPESQDDRWEKWIDVSQNGTPISFFTQGQLVDGAFKIHGRRPDIPEADEFNSDFTRNLSEAIQLSRVGV